MSRLFAHDISTLSFGYDISMINATLVNTLSIMNKRKYVHN